MGFSRQEYWSGVPLPSPVNKVTHVYLWWIHFDIWQNQYNIVKFKNKIKLKKNKTKERKKTKNKKNKRQCQCFKATVTINLEKAMAPHSSTLAWKIPWMEEPGGLQSMGSLRVEHD